jgi:hypothetical protein
VLNFHGNNFDPAISLLKALVKEKDISLANSSIAKYVRTLYIHSFTPIFYNRGPPRSRNFLLEDIECHVGAAGEVQSKLSLLKPALMSLRNLDTIRYDYFLSFPSFALIPTIP